MSNTMQIDTKNPKKTAEIQQLLQQQAPPSTKASTTVQSPVLQDINYEYTGKMSNIFWHRRVAESVE